MTRNIGARRKTNVAKVRRATALERNEFRYPSEPRTAPAGATSFPVKATSESDRKLIDEALAARRHPE